MIVKDILVLANSHCFPIAFYDEDKDWFATMITDCVPESLARKAVKDINLVKAGENEKCFGGVLALSVDYDYEEEL